MNKENKSKMSDFNDENGNFDCVIFKHKLQERIRKETKNMNVDEYVEYINKKENNHHCIENLFIDYQMI